MKKLLMAAVVAFMMLGGAGAASAQEDDGFFDLQIPDFAVGWGTMFGEEDETFSQAAQFAAVHANLLGLNKVFDLQTGVGVEVQFGGALEYTVWSLNRATVPKTENMYAGSDLKLIQSSDDGGASRDFDMRLVTGYVTAVGPGELRMEVYFLEENRPVAFALLYGF